MTGDFSQDPALVHDFLVESEELLQGMDQDMVLLESTPQDVELLNRVFRALHTIKGTAGFLGFDPIVRLSHRAEDVLNAVRRGEVQLQRSVMDALLAARDRLGMMLNDIQQGGLRQYEDLDALLQELEDAHKPRATPPTLGELLVKDQVITRSTLDEVLAEQAASPTPRKLGQLLVEKGLSTPVQVGEALARQKQITDSAASAATLRVEARKLDELINLIGELVLERNRLAQLSRELSSRKLSADDLDAFLHQSTARLSFITDELQTAGLRTRMVPIETVFRKFPRLVRDVARTLHKEVNLVLTGEDTELDKTMVELIGDPLVHLVRNALDHGIELPDVRVQAGKPRPGTIRLEARQEGDQIVIGICDDGGGINPERVGKKALDKGLVTAERLRQLTPREIMDFIFLPGFSTAEVTSDISGRGVGLDVVRSNLRKLNGTIEIDSKVGQGTTMLLHLPLTLAIFPVLLVKAAEEIYALPLRSIVETAQATPQQIHALEGSEFLRLRNETLPLLRLGQILGGSQAGASRSGTSAPKVVILTIAEKRIALLVDHLLGQESTVIKPVGTYLRHCASLAGATISGDGLVRLVLDPAGLLAETQRLPLNGQEVPA